ncbi:MAG TPA: dihydrodipicolinate synthase family protein [Terracidiphilus sp.]|nr:dihydrodipicolinate synthase family protein [Terracidiphilus sp.]
MLLEGIFAAVTTPFYSDERVYFRKLEANMECYSRSLLAGMVVLGSTGEAVSLDDAESRDVLRTAAAATAPDKVLIAGVGRESVKGTVELAEAAASFHYDAVLVKTPSYYRGRMSDPAAVLHYFRSVADRSPLPVILYNIPQNVPYEIPIPIIAELAQHPKIIGIKDSQGLVDRISATVEATRNAPRHTVTVTPVFEAVTERMLMQKLEPPTGSFVPAGELAGGAAVAIAPPSPAIRTRTKEVGFQTLVGSGTGVFAGLQAGACGAVLAFAACASQACTEIYIAWKEHDLKLAEEKQQRIVDAVKRICVGLGLSGLKYACDFNGYYGGRARSPLLPITAEQKAEVERALAEIRN